MKTFKPFAPSEITDAQCLAVLHRSGPYDDADRAAVAADFNGTPEAFPERVEEVNEYHAQADAFLARFGLKCRITLSNSKPAPWDDYNSGRNHYRVTLSRPWIVTKIAGSTHAGKPTRLVFDFWASIRDSHANKPQHAYDVLACISMDSGTPETFADFCAEYGYNTDSISERRANLQTFRRAHAFAKRLRAFFTADELAALAEIR